MCTLRKNFVLEVIAEDFLPHIFPSLPARLQTQLSKCMASGLLPYLVLKLAGCGCPSYKDKKSYSSSTAKDWKTIWILLPSSATITQVQFAPFGYPYGKPGLSIVPFLPFKVPPQVWIKPGKKRNKHQVIIKCEWDQLPWLWGGKIAPQYMKENEYTVKILKENVLN